MKYDTPLQFPDQTSLPIGKAWNCAASGVEGVSCVIRNYNFLKKNFKRSVAFSPWEKNYTKLGKGPVSEGSEVVVIPIWPGKNEQRTVFLNGAP